MLPTSSFMILLATNKLNSLMIQEKLPGIVEYFFNKISGFPSFIKFHVYFLNWKYLTQLKKKLLKLNNNIIPQTVVFQVIKYFIVFLLLVNHFHNVVKEFQLNFYLLQQFREFTPFLGNNDLYTTLIVFFGTVKEFVYKTTFSCLY